MQQQVNPPTPIVLISFFTFVILFSSLFVIVPVVIGIVSVVVAAVELMLSSNNVSGDFSNVALGTFLWRLAGWPFVHWLITAIVVVVGTAAFVLVTRVINKDRK